MSKMIVTNRISIQAPAARVWDALTNPFLTKIYMYGCETVSDWKVGSPLQWRGSYEGKEMVFVSGVIVDIQPNVRLVYTVFDPNSGMEDIPQNHLNVTYTLAERDGETELVITQDGFETAAEGEKRYQEVYNNGEGWNPILVEIKKLVESEA
ncbi:MAG: SRPBCC domain-containing protein [Saprospirales bacterium]|nr:SRPBCC domain-containing protein [Saprospirales bacterium]